MALPRRLHGRQHGGTITGLVIGLIIGLLIAVWVAMTIMKTPLPFVDKMGKQPQNAGELGDPNKRLQGSARDRRERAADDLKADPEDADISKPAPAPATLPAAPPPAASTPAPSAPPVAQPPAADKPSLDKPATTSPQGAASSANVPPSANGDAFTYYLQAGAFRELQDAEATKARLALMGVAASIAERKSELGTLYRVRVGPFADVDAMNRARVRLSDNGVDAAIVRVPK